MNATQMGTGDRPIQFPFGIVQFLLQATVLVFYCSKLPLRLSFLHNMQIAQAWRYLPEVQKKGCSAVRSRFEDLLRVPV